MKRRIAKSSVAIADIIECAIYLGQQSPGTEDRFLDAVEAGLDLLAGTPEIGGRYQAVNPRLDGLRVWRVGGFERYLVFYMVGADRIEIVRVLHGARDLAAIFDLL